MEDVPQLFLILSLDLNQWAMKQCGHTRLFFQFNEPHPNNRNNRGREIIVIIGDVIIGDGARYSVRCSCSIASSNQELIIGIPRFFFIPASPYFIIRNSASQLLFKPHIIVLQ